MKDCLLMPRSEFKSALEVRIAEGKAILDTFDNAQEQSKFEKLEKAFRLWNSYNIEWLLQYFTEPKSHSRRYNNSGSMDIDAITAINQGANPNNLDFRKYFFPRKVSNKIEYLEDLLNKIDLIPIADTKIPTISSPIIPHKMASNSFHFGDGANVNLVQGVGAVQANVTGSNASANVATGNSNTQATQIGHPVSLPELVAQLKQALADSAFDSHRDELEHELGHVEIQLKKAEPKKSILERSFDYLKDMAVKSAGPAAASTVIELIKHAPALLAAHGL